VNDPAKNAGPDEVAKVLAEAETAGAGDVDQGSIDALLNQAQAALSSLDEPAALPAGVKPFEFKDLSGTPAANETASLDLLRDVQLDLKIELGRTQMHLEDVLRLKQGAVVTLDKLAGDPVDIYANGRLIARGEVLVLNDNFCVRVAELIAGDDAAA
jgi:flagellar motor switch protein FliN/FliY